MPGDSFSQFVTYGRDPRAETLRQVVGPMFAATGRDQMAIAKPASGDPIAAIVKALGLKHVRGFTLDMPWGNLPTVTTEQLATGDDLAVIAGEIVKRRWKLVEIDEQGNDVVQPMPWSVPPAPQSRPAETRQSTRPVQGETAAELERYAMPAGWTATQLNYQPTLEEPAGWINEEIACEQAFVRSGAPRTWPDDEPETITRCSNAMAIECVRLREQLEAWRGAAETAGLVLRNTDSGPNLVRA